MIDALFLNSVTFLDNMLFALPRYTISSVGISQKLGVFKFVFFERVCFVARSAQIIV